ncbi:ethylene receptor [Stemphylium lycopersici]|uniref:Ethylene receptor n=1 Tax=Stemphylium lycopersici TaxID=183478 RepID=A0A364MVP8_STELY|nr:ethylene receptor [Stemphylium lycopersici]RAR04917.1 ethylene receptor [Stemphylium lycopersici]
MDAGQIATGTSTVLPPAPARHGSQSQRHGKRLPDQHHQPFTTRHVAQAMQTIPEPDAESAHPDLAAITLLDALDGDDRPSFATYIASARADYDAPLRLVYSNAALHTAAGMLARITGKDGTSVFAESTEPQRAFRDWVCGWPRAGDVQCRGSAYTFEGHIWNALTVGRYRIISGVPTLLLWAKTAPGGTSMPHANGASKALQSEAAHRLPAASSHHGEFPSASTRAKRRSFHYTPHLLPPDLKPDAHAEYFRSVDWASTPLGPMDAWPADLRCMANMMLSNSAPAVLFWGDDVIMLYNEPYVQLLGALHPCMGKSARKEAPDHWLSFQPIIDHIKATGESMAEADMQLFINRDGFLEETHWSFQFMPMLDQHGRIVAYYQTFFEVTTHSLLQRRISSLVALGTQNASARDFASFWSSTLSSLSLNDKDVPFALLYAAERHVSAQVPSVSSPGSIPPLDACILKGTVGVDADHPIAPATINIVEDSYILHTFLRRTAKSGKATVVHLDHLPASAAAALEGIKWRGYGDPCRTIVICPIIPTSGDQVEGFLIIGVNPRRPFDEEYQQYLQVMGRLLATSLASIVLFEEEVRQREKAIIQAALIQEQLMAEIKLKEGKFQRFAERCDVAIFIVNARGDYTYRNQRWYDMFEVAKFDTNATEAWHKIAFEEDISYCEGLFMKLAMNHESVCFELRTRMPWSPPSELSQVDPDHVQHYAWILCSAYPELSPDGELLEIVGNVTDISKQKWAEGIQKFRTDTALQGKQHLEHFIDTTSHEMRNPLSAIMQCADSITSTYEQDDRHVLTTNGWSAFVESTLDAAQTIAQCAQHMRHIVDDILTISKLDSGLLDMTPVVAQPENIARHAVKMFDAEARAAGIDITLVVDQSYRDMEVKWASLDPTRVLQVLINLLTNAIKFTRLEKVKSIKVALFASATEPTSVPRGIEFIDERLVGHDQHLEDDWKQGEELIYLQFSVTDTGRGLSEEEKGTLFTRFSQASPRTHINYGGSGLGLFISRRLTELQGGAIGLSSTTGKGSTFSFYIKTRQTQPKTARKDSLPQVFPEDVKHRSPVNQSARPLPPLRTLTSEDARDIKCSSPTVHPASASASARTVPSKHAHVQPDALGLPLGPDLQELKRSKNIPEIMHVLIVEDNLVNQRVLAKQLRRLGCIVSVANHGREALDFLPKTNCWNHTHPLSKSIARKETCHVPSTEPMPRDYDDALPIELSLILMDWEMPIMNGLTAVTEIRKLEKEGLLQERIPVIGVTANVRQQQIDMAIQAGMDDVVGKPFRVAELLVRMRGIVTGVGAGEGKDADMGGYESFG